MNRTISPEDMITAFEFLEEFPELGHAVIELENDAQDLIDYILEFRESLDYEDAELFHKTIGVFIPSQLVEAVKYWREVNIAEEDEEEKISLLNERAIFATSNNTGVDLDLEDYFGLSAYCESPMLIEEDEDPRFAQWNRKYSTNR